MRARTPLSRSARVAQVRSVNIGTVMVFSRSGRLIVSTAIPSPAGVRVSVSSSSAEVGSGIIASPAGEDRRQRPGGLLLTLQHAHRGQPRELGGVGEVMAGARTCTGVSTRGVVGRASREGWGAPFPREGGGS